MRGIIFAGGDEPCAAFAREIVRENDYIICLDKGLEYADLAGIKPSVILGDFDSVDKEVLEKYRASGTPVIDYPAEKDFTDMELGIRRAVEKGVSELVLRGALGGRLDHTLSNIDNLIQAAERGVKAAVYGERQHLHVICKEGSFHYKKGSVISLIPLSEEVRGVTTKNLLYPLKEELLVKGFSRGVSNVFTEDEAIIKVKSGVLLVIVNI